MTVKDAITKKKKDQFPVLKSVSDVLKVAQARR